MPTEDGIQVEGAVVEALSERLYRVELSNGHRLLAHMPRVPKGSSAAKRHAGVAGMYAVGQKVTVEMSPFDFSKGRISIKNS